MNRFKFKAALQTDDRALLEEWMSLWKDSGEFEVVPVVVSEVAQAGMSARICRRPRSRTPGETALGVGLVIAFPGS